GGDILAEEFRKRGAEVLCVDVYHTAPEGKKLYLKSIGVEVSDVVSKSEFDLALLPVHCPDAFLEGTEYGDKKTFSDAVNEFVDSDVFRIEVTGMKGKTSTCYLLAHVLDCAGKKVFLHTSRGQGPYDSGVHHIERVMSIAPTSLLKLPKCGYDINIAEVSLGGSGKADVSIVTNLLEDYGIAKNTKKASCAKSKVFGDGINIVRKDEAPMWSFVSGNHKLDPFDDVTKVVGSPRVGEGVQISFPYIGRMYKATLDSSYLSVQYIPAIDIVLHVCCKMNIAIDDIIKGLESFANNCDVPIYTSEPTWRKIVGVFPDVARKNCKLFRGEKTFNNVQVISFPTSHDAVDSHGYSFLANDKKMTYVTDLGFVTSVVQDAIENCEVLIIESNHDIDMLKNGSYPDWLKKRILSTQGHLANIVTADTLARLKHLPEEIFLAHLSQHNNNRELAFETTDKCLRKSGSCTKVLVASQNEVVANF
ncbi:MAG: hypothetical protein MJ032_03360, partial [Acidaminococcaceae bacterium]|nr:hypothetical protein [Acidaminococcaceae bacterium]